MTAKFLLNMGHLKKKLGHQIRSKRSINRKTLRTLTPRCFYPFIMIFHIVSVADFYDPFDYGSGRIQTRSPGHKVNIREVSFIILSMQGIYKHFVSYVFRCFSFDIVSNVGL